MVLQIGFRFQSSSKMNSTRSMTEDNVPEPIALISSQNIQHLLGESLLLLSGSVKNLEHWKLSKNCISKVSHVHTAVGVRGE